MKWVKTLFWTAVFIFTILFSVQNNDLVTLRFGFYPLENHRWVEVPGIPLFLVILGSVFLGVLIGGIGDLYKHFKLKRALGQNEKTIERLEGEIRSLRGIRLDAPSLSKKEAS